MSPSSRLNRHEQKGVEKLATEPVSVDTARVLTKEVHPAAKAIAGVSEADSGAKEEAARRHEQSREDRSGRLIGAGSPRMPTGMLRLLTIAALLLPLTVWSARECRDDLDEADGYTIRSVKVEGRWVPSIPLPIKPGDRFSNAGVQQAMRAVQEALHSEDRQQFELQNVGAVGVMHITRCLMVEGKQVDVIIQPRSLRVDLFEVGGNVLPIPRAPFATFYDAVPKPILRFESD